jgi:hypothetical protein
MGRRFGRRDPDLRLATACVATCNAPAVKGVTLGASLFVAVALAASGCGSGDSTGDAAAARADAAEQAAQAAAERRERVRDVRRWRRIRRDFRENFGIPGFGADWYSGIRRIRLSGEFVTVDTDFYEDAEGEDVARTVCFAMYNIASEQGIEEVMVTGQDGGSLATCP